MERLPLLKKGGMVGLTKCVKGSRIMLLADDHGTPLSAGVHSASHSEVKLIESLLDHSVVHYRDPERLLYDEIADSDPLRHRLYCWRGIEVVIPHKRIIIRKRLKTGECCAATANAGKSNVQSAG
ncbi:MAG: hypothetical protein R3C11_27740 [Planctomycetaceae bacterium]